MSCFKKLFTCILYVSSFMAGLMALPGFAQNQSGKHYILKPAMKFDHLTMAEGLSNSMVYSMVQDQKGFMWFGTGNGLNRYDGYNFTVYKHDPQDSSSLGDNTIHAITQDRDGKLWIGTLNGLNLFDPQTEKAVRYHHQPGVSSSLSDNYINEEALCMDRTGTLWIGTRSGLNRFNPQTNTFTQFLHSNDAQSLSHNNVTAIFEDSGGTLWIGTEKGLNSKLTGQKSFLTPVTDPHLQPSTAWGQIHSMGEDNLGFLWVGTSSGIYKKNPKTGIFERYTDLERYTDFGRERFTSIVKDSKGTLWLGSFHTGLYSVDPTTNKIEHFEHDPAKPSGLSSFRIHAMAESQPGILWIGTTNNGVDKLNISNQQFTAYHSYVEYPGSLKNADVHGLYEDTEGNIWIGSAGNGIFKLDPLTGKVIVYNNDPANSHSLPHNWGFEIEQDSSGMFWIGTYSGGLNYFNPRTEQFIHYLPEPGNPRSISDISAITILQEEDGGLWIGTVRGGLNYLDPKTRQFTRYMPDPADPGSISPGQINSIIKDENGDLWLTTEGGGLNRMDRKTGRFFAYRHNPADSNSISSDIAMYVYKDNTNTLWVGTRAGLDKMDAKTGKFTTYTTAHGLPDNYIVGITEDNKGNLWISTKKGLCSFNPKTEVFHSYDMQDGLNTNDFKVECLYKSKDGKMYFGGANGFTVFHPDSIRSNIYVPPVHITGFKIFDKKVNLNEKEINLSYQENFFSFDFVALNYLNSQRNQYAYQLEGVDKDWVYSGSRRYASYTNLDPGTYVFQVKGSNNAGVWNEQEASIKIIIHPPWWRTWWAYSLYALLALGTILSIRHYEIKRFKLRQQATYLSELDSLKSRFFANISHEFRTPLTLILGPVKKLMNKQTDPEDQSNLSDIQRNAHRLLHLVNQLLDLSKLEACKLKLEAVKSDIIAFLRSRASGFTSMADYKHIYFSMDLPDKKIGAYFDQDKLEKILNNLLSNAFKFTPEGGTVRLKVHPIHKGNKDSIQIQVSDTGRGMPAEEINRIFDRFYQVDSSQTNEHEGTGIGLALTKELVELHYGVISVESTLGHGSTFTIELPLGKEHLKEEEIIQELPLPAEQTESVDAKLHPWALLAHLSNNILEQEKTEKQTEKPVILIVEDNQEVRRFIGQTISDYYQVQEAEHGVMGLEMAKALLPDLIISDVMMPQMDGYQLCEKIKTDELISHIPVILLTARADRQSKLTGLATRADDYLSKPFDSEELLLIIRNHIEERRKMQQRFSRDITLEPKHIAITSLDEQFLSKLMDIIEEHMEDENFTIEELSQQAGYSHMHLYRKIKALTDQTPSQFLRTVRLKRAAAMLQKKSDHVTQIAYSVGFSSLSYFNKCFKEQFGKTPTQFAAETQVIK